MKYISFLLLLSIVVAGCSSSNSVPNEGRIPTKWEGDWVWFRSYGGIGGSTYTPEKVGYRCTLRIGADNALSSVLRNDTGLCTMPYPIVKVNDSVTNLVVRPDSLVNFLMTSVQHVVLVGGSFDIGINVSNDTLNTWDRDVADGFESWFVKQK